MLVLSVAGAPVALATQSLPVAGPASPGTDPSQPQNGIVLLADKAVSQAQAN